MSAYAKRSDVYQQGFPSGALRSPARPVASVDVATNRFEVEGHGCAENMPVQFAVDQLGVLPAGLSVSTVYYARPVRDSESWLEVATAPGAPAVNITTAGEGSFKLYIPTGPLLDVLTEVYSRWYDGKAIAHEAPLKAPYPITATHAVAVRTAAHAARVLGLAAQGEQLFAAEEMLLRDIPALVRGASLRDPAATAPANLATVAVAGSAIANCSEPLP